MPAATYRAAVLTAVLAAAALAGCSPNTTADNGNQAVTTATAYMHAWLDLPARPAAMCRLQTQPMRPNYRTDGGSLNGCIAAYTADFAGQDTHRPPLALTVTDPQPVPATASEPAGTGILVAGHRPGDTPFRYALRLVQQGGTWYVQQVAHVDEDRYGNTADPVASVLGAA